MCERDQAGDVGNLIGTASEHLMAGGRLASLSMGAAYWGGPNWSRGQALRLGWNRRLLLAVRRFGVVEAGSSGILGKGLAEAGVEGCGTGWETVEW